MFKIDRHDVLDAHLLSAEEAEKLPQWLLSNGGWWWLCTPGSGKESVMVVLSGGGLMRVGYNIATHLNSVRPALKIRDLDAAGLEVGDLVMVLGQKAQYIGNDSVLLCRSITERRFDGKSCNYNESELKQYLDNWLKEEIEHA